MGRVTRRDRGALEKEVVAALAAAGRPLTPSEVQAELGGVLAYTTVMTSLVRLADKGVLQRDRTGRAYAYRLIGDATVMTARRMRQLLESGSDRAGVLASVAQAFARHNVSIQTVRQEGRGRDAQLVVVTHTAPDSALSATVEELRRMDIVWDVISVMRVEGEGEA